MILVEIIHDVNAIIGTDTNNWQIIITTLPIRDAIERQGLTYNEPGTKLIASKIDNEYKREVVAALSTLKYDLCIDLPVNNNGYSIYVFPVQNV